MRKIEMEVWDNGFHLNDKDGQFVDVEHDDDLQRSYFVSMLHGDEDVHAGSCNRKDALYEAFRLMGVE